MKLQHQIFRGSIFNLPLAHDGSGTAGNEQGPGKTDYSLARADAPSCSLAGRQHNESGAREPQPRELAGVENTVGMTGPARSQRRSRLADPALMASPSRQQLLSASMTRK